LFDGTSFTRFTTDENAPFENVRSIIEDRKGNIWLGGNNGLWRYDGSEFSKVADGFAGYVYEDTKGNIWTSSAADGQTLNWVLSRYDEQTSLDANATPTQIKQEDGLLFGILEDKAGNIWFGTLKGVCRYDGKSFATFQNAGTGR
jgi:ligand-binding sensor domain-containing protein